MISQLLTESVLVTLGGAALGLIVAAWGIDTIRAYMPPEVEKYIPGWNSIRLDGRALAFTVLAAVASGILAGLAPAWQSARSNLHDCLKEGGRDSRRGGRGTGCGPCWWADRSRWPWCCWWARA